MVWTKCCEGSEPQVHHLWNGNCNIYLTEVLRGKKRDNVCKLLNWPCGNSKLSKRVAIEKTGNNGLK